MKLYAIATRGRNNKEIYLKCKETENDTIQFEWCEDIEQSYSLLNYYEIEDFGNKYFKNYKKWYVKEWCCDYE